MEIPSGSVNQLGKTLQRAGIEARYQETRQLERLAGVPRGEDRLEISQGARDMARLRGVLLEKADLVPEIRQDRMADVRSRIASGFYNREDIVAQISDRLLKQPALSENIQGISGNNIPDATYREDLMREVNSKIQSGFYSDKDVMSFVADRLVDIYQISSEDES